VQFSRTAAAETQTNIAPLLDVVLLLLIFFMVTTSFADRQIALDLPSAQSGSPQATEAVVVAIDAKGILMLDGEPISEEELTSLLETLALQERDLEIRADTAVQHGYVVRVLDLAKRVGLIRVGIVVDADHER